MALLLVANWLRSSFPPGGHIESLSPLGVCRGLAPNHNYNTNLIPVTVYSCEEISCVFDCVEEWYAVVVVCVLIA